MLDALAYVKAARVSAVPAALEISQSGRGGYVWIFFADAVPAATALLREAMVLRGSMGLRSYDQRRRRRHGHSWRTPMAAPLTVDDMVGGVFSALSGR